MKNSHFHYYLLLVKSVFEARL